MRTILLISLPSSLSSISLLSPSVSRMLRPLTPPLTPPVTPPPLPENLPGVGDPTLGGTLAGVGVAPKLVKGAGEVWGEGGGGGLLCVGEGSDGLLGVGEAGGGLLGVGDGSEGLLGVGVGLLGGGGGGGGVLGSGSLTSWNSPNVASGTASMLGKSLASIVSDLMLLSRGAKGVCKLVSVILWSLQVCGAGLWCRSVVQSYLLIGEVCLVQDQQ